MPFHYSVVFDLKSSLSMNLSIYSNGLTMIPHINASYRVMILIMTHKLIFVQVVAVVMLHRPGVHEIDYWVLIIERYYK